MMPGAKSAVGSRGASAWLRVLLVPVFFAWLVAALLRAQAWWHGADEAFGVLDWVLLGSLPALAWVYLRHLSVFGRGRGQCLLPEDRNEGRGRR